MWSCYAIGLHPLVTPGGTVSADVRAVSYIGIPLAIGCHSDKSKGLTLDSADATNLAKSMGTLVGTVGTVLFYGTATMNLFGNILDGKHGEKKGFKETLCCRLGSSAGSHTSSFISCLHSSCVKTRC